MKRKERETKQAAYVQGTRYEKTDRMTGEVTVYDPITNQKIKGKSPREIERNIIKERNKTWLSRWLD